MPPRKKPSEDKSKPNINFIIFLPIRFDISAKDDVMRALDFEVANQNKSRSEAWREMVFKLLHVKNANELIKNYKINKKITEMKEILDEKMGIPVRERSEFLLNKMKEEYLKGDTNEK